MSDARRKAEVRCVVARLSDAREALYTAEKAVIDAKCYAEDFGWDVEEREKIEDVDSLLARAGKLIDVFAIEIK